MSPADTTGSETGRRSLPALPDVPPGTDPRAAALLTPLKEIVEIREGLRGDPLARFVTLADLVALGLVSRQMALGNNARGNK